MKIKWLGHASFLITSEAGTKIITDPYASGDMGLNYGEIKETADIVTVSHGHGDHNNVAAVKGNPKVIKETTPVDIKGIKLSGISTYHDDSGGSKRGGNIIFCFVVDGIRICHLGDLGHPLTGRQIAEIGKPDILFIPVGGNFTIDAKAATQVCDKLTPKVIIPMHYKNERCPTFPVAGVDEFLRGKQNVSKSDASELDFTREKLPATTQIIVLKPAL
jgi:L-ascorbate metabolism protein UlaG (beta-lactamase superfamily)